MRRISNVLLMSICMLLMFGSSLAVAQSLQHQKVKYKGTVIKIKDQYTFKDGVCYIKDGGSDNGKVFFHRDMEHLALAKNDISNATQIAANDKYVFVINNRGKLFRYTPNNSKWGTDGTWEEIGRGTSQARFNASFNSISKGTDGNMYLTKSAGNDRYWKLDNNGRLTKIAITVTNPKKLVYIKKGTSRWYWVLNTQNKLTRVNSSNYGTNTTNLKLKDIRVGFKDKLIGIEDNPLYTLREVLSTTRLGFIKNAVVGLQNANVDALAKTTQIRDLGGYYFEGKTQAYAKLKTGELARLYFNAKSVNRTNAKYEVRLVSIDARGIRKIGYGFHAQIIKNVNQSITPAAARGKFLSGHQVKWGSKTTYSKTQQQSIMLSINNLEEAFVNPRKEKAKCINLSFIGPSAAAEFCDLDLAKMKVGVRHTKNFTYEYPNSMKVTFSIRRIK